MILRNFLGRTPILFPENLMKYWLPLVLLVGNACSPATDPTSQAPVTGMGLELVTPGAAQLNTSLLSKSANVAPQTLRIHHSSLEKPFLYIAAIMETSAPNSHYTPFQPRLVKFSQAGNSIVLSDIRPHQRYTEEDTLPRIIAQFPIVQDDADGIEFDFALGMKNVFTIEGRTDQGTQSGIFIATPQHSYIAQLTSSNNALSLEHHYTSIWDKQVATIVVRHIFMKDFPTTITPREADTSRVYGFFVTPPWYEFKSDVPHRYIAHWDIQKPISVALSPNIPLTIRPAIEAAVHNWNTVLGRDVLQVVPNAADLGPLDLRHDITINWVTNDANGTAFGAMMMHPATGQILHGDVMLPSARLKYISNYSGTTVSKFKKAQATPDGFESAEVCTDMGSNSSQDALPVPSSANLQVNLAQRMIQQVVTHELGHVLGLRHNFAGSSQGNLTSKQTMALLTKLIQGEAIDDTKQPSTSIMDYLINTERLFMTRPGPYDVAAIQWAYLSQGNTTPRPTYRYCTDEDTNDMELNADQGTMADCQRFDYGSDPLLSVINELEWAINGYLAQLIKLANSPTDTLAKTPLAKLPSIELIKVKLYQLHNYVRGVMQIWPTETHTSLERFSDAEKILEDVRSLSVADIPMIQSARANLRELINHGDRATQLRANDGDLRLTLGIRKLEMLLDLKPGSLNKKSDGTTADINYGD
jgi:hypothetical protein